MVIITISGTSGSGKSTVGQLLKEKLKMNYIYSGQIFRETAKKYKMSLEEFGKYCENNENIDKELDEKQLNILKKGDIILEGRLAGWIAHKNNIQGLKIMLNADFETRIKRIIEREDGEYNKRLREILEREKSEEKRYDKYYNIDIKDTSIYDLIIDSSNKKPEEIIEIIIQKIEG
ncbi:MAG: cytidylate kinase family protein [Candidatus Thermoplasmatota archaeon]|nr:cytidylate kinase family protein [Candidatus Thermoplasmatota archaeon]MCK5300860.1 cytidylate kinase family protein [Thermoplasmatales archaeon]